MSTEISTVKVKDIDPSIKSGISIERVLMAARLKTAREASGLTVVEFGNIGGVTKQTQLAYERGDRPSDADYLRALHNQLGIDPAYLITGRTIDAMKELQPMEVEFMARYRDLPPKMKNVVDEVLLLAWLAYKDRKAYHESEAQLRLKP